MPTEAPEAAVLTPEPLLQMLQGMHVPALMLARTQHGEAQQVTTCRCLLAETGLTASDVSDSRGLPARFLITSLIPGGGAR